MTKISSEQDKCDTALLLIDVINDLDFEGNERLIAEVPQLAENLHQLKSAAVAAKIPVIYLNDNFRKWRSNFNDQLEHCLNSDVPGRPLAEKLKPTEKDYFVLKPMHSGFYGTPLEILLADLGVKKLILAGIATDICVMYTANDAYMRGFELLILYDCVISNTSIDKTYALDKMKELLKARICSISELERELPLLCNSNGSEKPATIFGAF